MSVEREEVERIARLAKLRLTEEETDRLTDDMGRILEHAERLRDVAEVDGPVAPGLAGSGASEQAAGEEGSATRAPGADAPDRLHRPPAEFAPDMRDGLFAVPPPPGVLADGEAGEAGGDLDDGAGGNPENGAKDRDRGATS